MQLSTAPTHHQKFIEAKLAHIATANLAIRQKRAVTAMKVLPKTEAINQKGNAMYHQQVAEIQYDHRMNCYEEYDKKVKAGVAKTLEQDEKQRCRDEK